MVTVVQLNGGAGDDDIQTAECLHRRGDGRLDLLLMTDVGGSCQSLVASALQCCSHLGNPVRGHTGDGDGCSLACHVSGAGGADSRTTPRDQHNFSIQFHLLPLLSGNATYPSLPVRVKRRTVLSALPATAWPFRVDS